MPAMVTLLYLGTECGGTTGADISECPVLLGRQHMSPAIQELLTVLPEDIGDFQPMFRHRRRPSPSDAVISMTWILSSGLPVARSVRSETWR